MLKSYLENFDDNNYKYIRSTLISIFRIQLFGLIILVCNVACIKLIKIWYLLPTMILGLILTQLAPYVLRWIRGFFYFNPRIKLYKKIYQRKLKDINLMNAQLDIYAKLIENFYQGVNTQKYLDFNSIILTNANLRIVVKKLMQEGHWSVILEVNTLSKNIFMYFAEFISRDFNMTLTLFSQAFHLRQIFIAVFSSWIFMGYFFVIGSWSFIVSTFNLFIKNVLL